MFAEGSYWLIGVGIIGALLAEIPGLLDLLAIPRGTPAFKTALTHMSINLLRVGALRRRLRPAPRTAACPSATCP